MKLRYICIFNPNTSIPLDLFAFMPISVVDGLVVAKSAFAFDVTQP